MDEFSLIDYFFKQAALTRDDVVYGIGDDAACLNIPRNHQLLISTDTLVAGVHFLENWDAYDIAYKAVMVNLSDIAAMAATPCWITLALTLPCFNQNWLERFSLGLHESLKQYNVALIGGDTTRGPLSITLTILGIAPTGKAIRRSGANVGDKIYLSGYLGAAAAAVDSFQKNSKVSMSKFDKEVLMKKLQHPNPRVDLADILQRYASAAIDISDGLEADLNHLCNASHVGACLFLSAIPIHPLVKKDFPLKALDFALNGGDDYELCFTVSSKEEKALLESVTMKGLQIYPVGVIEENLGLRHLTETGGLVNRVSKGYNHFK